MKSLSPCYYLRSHIVWCPTEGVSSLVQVHLQLAHPEVHDPDVPLIVQEEVVQLEIPGEYIIVRYDVRVVNTLAPVHYPFPVEKSESADNLSRVESRTLGVKSRGIKMIDVVFTNTEES